MANDYDSCKCGAPKLIRSARCAKCHTESIRKSRAETFGKGHADRILPGVRRVVLAAYAAADEYGKAKLAALNKDIDFSASSDVAPRLRRGAGRHSRAVLDALGLDPELDHVVVSGVMFVNRSVAERIRLSSAAKRWMARVGSDPDARYYDCFYHGKSPNGRWSFVPVVDLPLTIQVENVVK